MRWPTAVLIAAVALAPAAVPPPANAAETEAEALHRIEVATQSLAVARALWNAGDTVPFAVRDADQSVTANARLPAPLWTMADPAAELMVQSLDGWGSGPPDPEK